MIYGGGKGDKWLSGEEEIYYLRDLILKYRSVDSLTRAQKGKIVIYDLSKSIAGTKSLPMVKNYWQAFPGDFKIRRSSDRPFTYKYSFEFTGIPIEEGGEFNSHAEPPKLDPGTLGAVQNIAEGLAAALDFVDGINAWVNDVLDKANQLSGLLKVLGNVMSYASSTLSGIADSAGDSAAGIVDGATGVVEGVNSVVSLPRTIQLKALNIGLEVQNAAKNLVGACDELSKNCRLAFSAEGYAIPQEVLDQFGMNDMEFYDSVNKNLNDMENAANELGAAAKSAEIPDVTAGNPDPETGEQRIVLSYGYTSVMLKSTDTLESLAAKYLGDPNRAAEIAAFNGIASISDLAPGDIIKIPVTVLTGKIQNNRIYARREDRDSYGRDIQLDGKGSIAVSASGDYALAEGAENLSQAVLLRLRESVAKRIRINTYGIRANIGDPAAGKAYILSSVEQTVAADPRVSEVEGISFTGAGDSMDVNVVYRDINSASGNAAGRI
jgi:LysM repeat protein